MAEALAIIAQDGLEKLSLREVARRLGVSHQAPYKHYPSRDHLLAEVVTRAFTIFAAHLDARPRSPEDPSADLSAMGEAYLRFARAHPLHYRLMFGTTLPDKANHPDMLRTGRHAFAILQDGLAALHEAPAHTDAVNLDAMFVWSAMHGLASILQSDAMDSLGLPPAVLARTAQHVLGRISQALAADPPAPPNEEVPQP